MPSKSIIEKRRLQNRESQKRFRERRRRDTVTKNLGLNGCMPDASSDSFSASDPLSFQSNILDIWNPDAGTAEPSPNYTMPCNILYNVDQEDASKDIAAVQANDDLSTTDPKLDYSAIMFSPDFLQMHYIDDTSGSSGIETLHSSSAAVTSTSTHPDKPKRRHAKAEFAEPLSSRGSSPTTNSDHASQNETTDRATESRAVRRLREVESLYKFGVDSGFIQEDPELQSGLRRMRKSFMQLTVTKYL